MEPVTLTIEEVEKVKSFQQKNTELVTYLGQLELQTLNLQLAKDNIKQDIASMNEEQNSFAQEIQTKYGEGQIDVEKGIFIAFPQMNA